MKEMLFVRVDDRLIHGQVIMGWVPFLRPGRIVVVSAEVAADTVATQAMAMGVPEEVEFHVFSPHAAAAGIAGLEPAPTLLVVASPVDLLPLARAGASLGTINLGGMRYEGGAEFTSDLFLRPADIEAFGELIGMGFEIERKMIPSAPGEPLAKLMEKKS